MPRFKNLAKKEDCPKAAQPIAKVVWLKGKFFLNENSILLIHFYFALM
jgi:hypothetical protein